MGVFGVFVHHDLNTMSDTCSDILHEPLFA